MQFDTRASTHIASLLMLGSVTEHLLADRLAGMPAAEAAALRAAIEKDFRANVDKAIALLSANPTASTSVVIAELPVKRDAVISQVLGDPAAPDKKE
jgi:hypothetical protein